MLHGERERYIISHFSFLIRVEGKSCSTSGPNFRDKVVYSVDIQETSDMYQKMTPFQGCNLLFHGSMS